MQKRGRGEKSDMLATEHRIKKKKSNRQNKIRKKKKVKLEGQHRKGENENALVTIEVSGTHSTCQTKNNSIALTFIHLW